MIHQYLMVPPYPEETMLQMLAGEFKEAYFMLKKYVCFLTQTKKTQHFQILEASEVYSIDIVIRDLVVNQALKVGLEGRP